MVEDQVRNVIELWERSIQSGDMKGILANHSQDILIYDVPEPIQSKGLVDYEKAWQLFYRHVRPGNDIFVIEGLRISAGDDVAFATGLIRIGGSKEPACRLTLGLKKIHGNWTIAHEHHSAPHKHDH